jgi:hypothetical protein
MCSPGVASGGPIAKPVLATVAVEATLAAVLGAVECEPHAASAKTTSKRTGEA